MVLVGSFEEALKKKTNGKKGQERMPNQFGIRLLSLIVSYLYFHLFKKKKEISFEEFMNKILEPGLVDHIVVSNKHLAKIYVRRNDDAKARYEYFFNIGSVDSFERKLEKAQEGLGIKQHDFVRVTYSFKTEWFPLYILLSGILLIFGAVLYIKGIAGIGKHVTKVDTYAENKVYFKDVVGCDEAKQEVMEFVHFLKNPKKYEELGAKIPKGALLVGPPGTGKTLLAKATAGESGVPFLSISGSDFLEVFVGVGAFRVRKLFKEARKCAPSIVFIDEINAIGRARSSRGGSRANDECESTLNQLLVEMDGFGTTAGVVVLVGTNRPDVLDKALLRPGRFDRQITIDKPDIKGCDQIFQIYLKRIKLDKEPSYYSHKLASLTPGFAGRTLQMFAMKLL